MHLVITVFLFLFSISIFAKIPFDSTKNDRFSIHAQATVINQFKPKFKAKYSGENSLSASKENKISITTTIFAGVRLWKGASIFINPELAGGSGLSGALGIADATNGETTKVGTPTPQIYLARFYYRQLFALDTQNTYQPRAENQLGEHLPNKYISFTIGKIAIGDYFDDNSYSHDPRTQFMSWSLMDNGAWDYAANVRGYTPSIVLEYISPKHEFRYGLSLVPLVANGSKMNWDISKASAHVAEYTYHHQIKNKPGAIRILGYINTANMGNYAKSYTLNPIHPAVDSTRKYGRNKFGFGISFEQSILDDLGFFARVGWNDGRNETWMFTEIDHTFSMGLSMTGQRWKRPNDVIGLAYVMSGISKAHQTYLKDGGLGFMLGDGNLNYKPEHLLETYYSAALYKQYIFLSGAYQLVINPGYNKDRQGPVNVLSARVHFRI